MVIDARPGPVKRPGDRRLAIRIAACRLFVAKGFASVAVEDIAGEVGISAPAVYRHYRNKHELLEAAVGAALETVESALEPTTGLESVIDVLARLSVENQEFGVLIVREAGHLQEGRRDAARRVRAIHGFFGQVLSEARPDLTTKAVVVLARGLFGLTVATSFNPACDESPEYVAYMRSAMRVYCLQTQLKEYQLHAQKAMRESIQRHATTSGIVPTCSAPRPSPRSAGR